ncbi:MAG: hypothetical protein Q8867_06895 [Bacteroidota bacterium]|nr:hypothetical protein [Bacteroidota bacterium]
MDIKIRRVTGRRDLRKFIGFPYKLFKGNTFWCPPLRIDEKKTLSRKRNPAFEFCEAEYFLAYKKNRLVGRIAGIINHKANDKWNEKLVRFGWIDFIDDPAVSEALISAVVEWGKSKGMTGIQGPLGFSDMDNEGMLIKGFDEQATMASIYNYSYYPEHMFRMGFEKAADWIQYEFLISEEIPDKVERISELVMKKYGLHVLKAKSSKDLLPYGKKMFTTLNQAFDKLYGYSTLSERQMDDYVKTYFNFIRPEFVALVLDEKDDVVGFGITMPSLTRALQKCNGKLFPFGFIYLLRAMKKNETMDMYVNGVRPDYQGKGVNSLYYNEMQKEYIRHHVKKAVTNPQLEDNAKALTIWKNFNGRQHLTRRCWIKHF